MDTLLASASDDTVRLWNATTGAELNAKKLKYYASILPFSSDDLFLDIN